MKMKKVVSLLLAVAMVLSMAACGKKADEPKKDSGDKEGGTKTISILWPETDSTQVDVMENYIQPAPVSYTHLMFYYADNIRNDLLHRPEHFPV